MKKKTAQSSIKEKTPTVLPEGFASEETTSVTKTSEAAPVVTSLVTDQKQIPDISIPKIDKNAELKIDSAPIVEEIPVQEKKNSFYFLMGTITGLLIIAITFTLGYFYLFSPNFNFSLSKASAPAPTSAPTPELTPTATPAPTIAKSDITVKVSNGSGKTGEAAKVGKQVEGMGYKVDSLGNAPDQTGTTIVLSKSLASQKDLVEAEFKKEFPAATITSSTEDTTPKIQITIGK